MPVIGAHVEARKGLWNAFGNATLLGADAIQVHPTPPGFWGSPKPTDEDVERFRQEYAAAGTPPFFFHAVYLINLASEDAKVHPRSESTLAGYLAAADRLGIDGVIFHVGSHRGTGFEAALPGITERMRNALHRADPQHTRLLIENNAGTGGCVGARFEEIRAMIDAVGDDRVRSCLDTCHAFASGYDLRTEADARRVIDDWDRVVGLDRLDAIHCNDSQTGLGSNRDRHQNIGLGEIGEEGFRALLHDPRLDKLPFILEVPGFEGLGPDAANVEILRRLAA
ncbi:MAG TPA: deoxyribonuclease IV [Candidatus Dormibacteraeota bacterium]